jgi:hypothetical protein
MTNEERIKADARAATDKRYPGDAVNFEYIEYKEGYIAGATTEHDRAQVLVDALEFVKHCPATWDKTQLLVWVDTAIKKSKVALEQWEGKEVGDE